MQIGEMFVNLGIKGSDKTVAALSATGKGMSEIKSMSLETKAAIVGVFYGLEQLMSHSAALGTSLTQSTALLGVSAKTLQQWQYAGVQAGDTMDGVTASLKGISSAMAEIYVGGGPAKYLGLVGERLLGKGGFDVNKAMKDPLYVMERLQTLAKDSSIPTGVLTKVMQSFGVGEGTNVALRKDAFEKGNFDKAPVLSDAAIGRLQKVQAMWSNLSQHVEMIFANFTQKHGAQLVTELSSIATALGNLADNLDNLAQKAGLFKDIAELFKVVNGAIEAKPGTAMGETTFTGTMGRLLDHEKGEFGKDWLGIKGWFGNGADSKKSGTTIHQNITHHGDASDTKAVGDTHKQAIKNAAKQSFALTQGN